MSRRLATVLVLALVLLSGCFTGTRPSFSDDALAAGMPTGDPAIDAVLARFDGADSGPFTAEYDALLKFGNTTRTAVVAVEPGRRSITVGSVRYIENGVTTETCSIDATTLCSNGFDPTRISDTGITTDFYAADTARRLRRDAQAKIGPTVARTETIAGQTAECIEVPLSGGTAVYCVLDNGVLALLDDGDVRVTLTRFAPEVDQALFDEPADN